MAGRLVETLLEDVIGLLRQGVEVAEEAESDVLLSKQRELVYERGGEEVHEQVDLMLRPLPVLGREGVDRKHVQAETDARGDRLPQGGDTRDVTL